MANHGNGRSQPGQPHSAVIDIGSNTVRLVVYAGPRRAPTTWLNEKVTARLGRDLGTSGRLPDKAMDLALAALARYAALLADIGVAEVQVVATAAVREAANGADFVARIAALGLVVRATFRRGRGAVCRRRGDRGLPWRARGSG